MSINIIPIVKTKTLFDGVVRCALAIYSEHEPWGQYLDTFCELFKKINYTDCKVAKGGIRVVYDPLVKPSAYTFDADEEIVICASDDSGVCAGIATALLAVKAEDGEILCDRVHIEDAPDKPYRSVMVDLARQWHPMYHVLKYVDICFLLKINVLHLHFIDDQSYTLPSRVYPKLSTKGRHYTFDEIKQLNDYASSRGITIVPEFEAPGHARALTSAYPEIFAVEIEGDSPTIVTESGAVVKADNIVCAKDEAFDAINALLAEICEMFPTTPYIHIGGDEANIKVWNHCKNSAAFMKENGLADEYELYAEFVARTAQMVIDLGRTPIVWEGFSEKGAERVPKETIVIAWESHYNLAPDLLKQGFKIINASWQPMYIVPNLRLRWGFEDILNWNVYNWQHWWEHSPARDNPINIEPTDDCLGGILCVWECTYEQEIARACENSTALAERTWNAGELTVDSRTVRKAAESVLKSINKLIQDM